MKLISSLIASCLAFTYAQNDTTAPSTAPTEMSTTMYTTQSIIASTKAYDPESDPTNDFEDCLYFWSGTLSPDKIDVYICGYADEDEMGYTDIKLIIPSDRWVVFGIQSSSGGSYSNEDTVLSKETFANFDGYNVIIPLPQQSSEPMERYYNSDKTFMDLESTIDVMSDTTDDDGRRTLRLTRPSTVMNDTSANITVSSDEIEKYFDFAEFTVCEDAARISITYGNVANVRFVASSSFFTADTFGNREAVTTYVEEEENAECDGGDSGDDASNIMVFGALIIGLITVLFHS